MELLVISALVAIGAIWYFNARGSKTTAEPEAAPYKVETPTLSEMAEKAEVVATKPAAVKAKAPVKRAAPVKAKAPAKTAAKKPVAKKTVSSKKPV
jgi:DNA-binding protein HU-beta